MSDEVNTIFNCHFNKSPVLFSERRQTDLYSREIDAFSGSKETVIFNHTLKKISVPFNYPELQVTVVNKDCRSFRHVGYKCIISYRDGLISGLFHWIPGY